MYNVCMNIEDKIQKNLKELKQQMFKIEVEVSDGGKLPFKVRQSDAGFDVYATSDFNLYPGTVVKHPLNIRMKLPRGTWAEITTKSGLGSKGQLVYAGVIDEEYRGIPHVIMTNLRVNELRVVDNVLNLTGNRNPTPQIDIYPNTTPIAFKKGDKIAQMIMNPYCDQYYVVQVDKVATETARGENGFGSTGAS